MNPFLSQPMSPGFLGRPQSVQTANPPILTTKIFSHTNPITHPSIYGIQLNNQTRSQSNRRSPEQPPKQHAPTTYTLPHQQPKPNSVHFSKWSRKAIERAIDRQEVISVYVENIPDRWLPTDIHLVMNRYAEVLDVFIPRKKNKSGKRFAFVRFSNNVVIAPIIQRINSMQIDSKFLAASVAKSRIVLQRPPVSRAQVPSFSRVSANRPFAEVVRAPQVTQQLPRAECKPQDKSFSAFIPKKGSPEWLDCCAFGVLKSPMPFKSLLNLFPHKESPVTDIIPLGGVSFLFRFQSVAERNALIGCKPDWFTPLFEVFRPWENGDSASNRLCWVLIKGTPPCAWSADFFRFITSSLGSMVDWSFESSSKNRMDVAEVLILTKSTTFINKVLSVQIGNKQFDIGVAESQHDPLDWDRNVIMNPSSVLSSGNERNSGDVQVGGTLKDANVSHTATSTQSQSLPQISKQHEEADSDDPFNLRPIINSTTQKVAPPQLSQPAHSQKTIPSEASFSSSHESGSLPIQNEQISPQPISRRANPSGPNLEPVIQLFVGSSPTGQANEVNQEQPINLVPYLCTQPSMNAQPKSIELDQEIALSPIFDLSKASPTWRNIAQSGSHDSQSGIDLFSGSEIRIGNGVGMETRIAILGVRGS
ncbi:hypothetical protein Tsubulata_006781 [Turnera subulata]|uniref:RRM domain-containing protein n=1 Tax=Turnera subulata TaxID=218843 RepID=A0A9Q0FW11_9ROSI|nr:hypothetical protein Tsubulata_006781 [Turnera subulata]